MLFFPFNTTYLHSFTSLKRLVYSRGGELRGLCWGQMLFFFLITKVKIWVFEAPEWTCH